VYRAVHIPDYGYAVRVHPRVCMVQQPREYNGQDINTLLTSNLHDLPLFFPQLPYSDTNTSNIEDDDMTPEQFDNLIAQSPTLAKWLDDVKRSQTQLIHDTRPSEDKWWLVFGGFKLRVGTSADNYADEAARAGFRELQPNISNWGQQNDGTLINAIDTSVDITRFIDVPAPAIDTSVIVGDLVEKLSALMESRDDATADLTDDQLNRIIDTLADTADEAITAAVEGAIFTTTVQSANHPSTTPSTPSTTIITNP
jgi:hypothetical protein